MQILETDLEFKLAEVKRDQDFAGRSASDQYIEATRRTLEYAKTQYGLGDTLEDAQKKGVPNPILATDAAKGLNEDALSEETSLIKLSRIWTFAKTLAPILMLVVVVHLIVII